MLYLHNKENQVKKINEKQSSGKLSVLRKAQMSISYSEVVGSRAQSFFFLQQEPITDYCFRRLMSRKIDLGRI